MRPPIALLLALCACAGGAPQKPAPKLNRWGKPLSSRPTPQWVEKLPQSTRGGVVAVGRSGPTFWPQDALNNARDDARGKLALQLAAHVERYGAASEASGRAANAVDVDKEATDLLLRNVRIEATWVDETGERDEPGAVWALAVLDLAPSSAPASATANTGSAIPAWLDRLPDAAGRMYATGYSGPAFRAEKAIDYATDAAVENLVVTLRSRVQAYQLLVQTMTGLSVEEFSHTDDPDQSFRDLVRKSARIEHVWFDADGIRAGDPPGSAWALAVIDVASRQGGYSPVANPDVGPALDGRGNAPAEDEQPKN